MDPRLEQFGELIRRWNDRAKLVSRGDVEVLATRHFADSLTLEPFLRGESFCDVGTGAGLPGIPIAISRPDLSVTLVERSANKLRFLRHVVLELRLENVTLIGDDARHYRPANLFDTVTARAITTPPEAWQLVRPLLRPEGVALLQSVVDLSNLDFDHGHLTRSVQVRLPGVDRPSWIAEITQVESQNGS